MTSRNYDVILTLANTTGFTSGSPVVGNTTQTVGFIAAVDTVDKLLKVKLANLQQEFQVAEGIHSNVITISGSANGALTAELFLSNVMSGNTTVAKSTITAIAPSTFIAEKNAFTQNPIVRLFSLYYPGEWYPPNEYGNPTGQGEGQAWPTNFPIRFAEIVGDIADDLAYNVTYDGISYIPFPVNVTGIEQSSDGKINELTLSVFNVDNLISQIVENPFLAGYNSSNAVMAMVGGELVTNIDPRTVNAAPIDVGDVGSTPFTLLETARNQGLVFSQDTVDQYGYANATFNYETTAEVNGTWISQKADSRDMLGGIVEIKTTFANFLDVWPEYSIITSNTSTTATVKNSMPYRIGDNVRSSAGSIEATVTAIDSLTDTLTISNTLSGGVGTKLYIINPDADTESYIEDTFKIDQLESLSDHLATFGLVSWLQYFKVVVPKRKYYKNTCQWLYKGAECQYPGPGGLPIPGTNPVAYSNTNPIAANNQIASSLIGDVCSKSLTACKLRNNSIHYGGFPGVGRSVPRA